MVDNLVDNLVDIFSTTVKRVKPAAATVMAQRARDMRAAGRDIISLSIGQPDFDTPDHIKAAAKQAIDEGDTKYPPIAGTVALKQAICEKFASENKLHYQPDQILVANGGKQVIFNAMLATLNPGDEVILAAPYWVSYYDIITLCGATPIVVETRLEDGFKLQPEMLAGAITANSKWLLLNSPSNPSGACYSAPELKQLTEVICQHPQLWVLSDDIYEHLRYDAGCPTVAALEPDLYERTLTLNGVSKTYCMTGWRIGYGAGPKPLIQAMTKLQSQSTSGACSISQAAATAALQGDQTFLEQHKQIFRQRRDLVLQALQQSPQLRCHSPEGAFYIFPECSALLDKTTRSGKLLDDDYAIAEALLEEAGVAVVHGAGFGLSPYIRLSYATSDALLEQACERINRFCAELS